MTPDQPAPDHPAPDHPAPEDIVAFWFPEGDTPDAREHRRLWDWRQRGGAHHDALARFAALIPPAAAGELDGWAQGAVGRLALILLLDPFTRLVWAGTSRAYANEPKARDLCLQGLDNGHFQALPHVWHKLAFKAPLEQCECDDPARHLAHLRTAIGIVDDLVREARAELQPWYALSAAQSRRHHAVIAHFGRYPHRNAQLGRVSTPQELAFVATGDLPLSPASAPPPVGA